MKSRMRENRTYGSVRGSRQAFHLKYNERDCRDCLLDHEKFELETFDNVLIRKLIECVKVLSKTEILVIFKGGYEVKIDIE